MTVHKLFDPDQLPIAAPLTRQIACIENALRRRRYQFPRLVFSGQMTKRRADEEIELMEAVRTTLIASQNAQANCLTKSSPTDGGQSA